VFVVIGTLVVAACLAGSEARPAPALNYYTRTWQMGDEGLPENNVTAVVQTRDGYLWLGTRSGLARFDGARFTVFDAGNTPAIRSSHVTCLFEAEDGTLWIGHNNGDVTTLREGKFSAVTLRPKWKVGKIAAICTDKTGDIWLLNQYGELGRVKDGEVIPCTSTRTVHFLTVAKNPQGGFWIQRDNDVSWLEEGKLRPLFEDSSPTRYVQGIGAARDGGLWVMMDRRVREWKDQRWIKEDELGNKLAPWDWAPSSGALETKEGNLAIATPDYGLSLISPDHEILQYCHSNGFTSDWVNAVCEDREGNLWVGTGNGGLAMLRVVNVTTATPPDKWEGRAVLSVAADADRTLWAGTEGAGLYALRDGKWTSYGSAEGLRNHYVWSVLPGAPGGLWAGTWGGGVFTLDGGWLARSSILGNLYIATVVAGRNGEVFVGTGEGLLKFEAGRTNWLARAPDVSSPDVRAICEAGDGTVWFGMSGGGLGCWKDGKVRQFLRADGLSSEFVQCLRLEKDGSLWIGTSGGGLSRFKDGHFATISKPQGLPDDVICDLEDDGLGNFWMSSHNGIIRAGQPELTACANGDKKKLHCLTFGLSDGLPSLECSGSSQPAGCKTDDGRLWFPTAKGLAVVDPRNIKVNPLSPPVVIEEMRVDDEPVAAGAGAATTPEIAPGRHRLEISYTGLSLAAPEKVRFKYRLEPLDRSWIEVGAKRAVDYSYLPPGGYVFRVTACNNDGIWNQTGATFGFEVLPFFWQTWWFRVLAGAGGAGVLGGVVLVATRRRMRRKMEQLEHLQGIERERARIAKDIHDDLGASLTRISMLSQSARADLTNSPAAAGQVDQICTTARELTRAMDEIVWAVNPQHDSLDSLANYLGKYAQDYLRAAGIRVRLNMPEELPPWALTAEVRHNLFLAFKEALHNIVKHSGAAEVRVVLTMDAHGFVLAIHDYGNGFAAKPNSGDNSTHDRIAGGHGLGNMQRRLEEIGGTCEIHALSPTGTLVRFDVPVKTQSKAREN
jgi:signal transduction histidine kinase/ligand-binding sensor domain-containing protein